VANPKTGYVNLLKYHEAERNQLANCELLTKEENGIGEKCDMLPAEMLAKQDKAYLDRHLIPANPLYFQACATEGRGRRRRGPPQCRSSKFQCTRRAASVSVLPSSVRSGGTLY
jgi:hypothetical protein